MVSSTSRPNAIRRQMVLLTVLSAVAGCHDLPDEPVGPSTDRVAATAVQPLVFRQIDEGFNFSCGVTIRDVAYCWGANDVGQLGDGTTTPRLQPRRVAGGLRFRHVSTGPAHACGLTTDNRIYCWGLNKFRGALGDSTTTDRHAPVPIYGGRRWLQVRAGNNRTCAITQANVTFCWGWNIGGSLGIGSSTVKRRLIPSRVSGTLKFTRLTGRNFHVCGTLASGKAYCWGLNENGRLGDGTTTDRTVPTAVAGGKTFQSLNAGGAHTCGLATDGKVYCWGENLAGQLGDGTTAEHHTPGPVTGGHQFSGVSTGTNRSTCAVTTTFKAYCWGEDTNGELGTGNTAPSRPVPTAVGGNTSFLGVTLGNKHTCGVARSTNLGYCWGLNDVGQLGDGGTASHFLPFPVAAPS